MQLVALPQAQELGAPSGPRRGAAAGLHGAQIGVAHEGRGVGLLGQQSVPLFRVNVLGVVVNPNAIIHALSIHPYL